jgi:hypothetical protein
MLLPGLFIRRGGLIPSSFGAMLAEIRSQKVEISLALVFFCTTLASRE